MNKYQIFVSSTYEDLKGERDAVIKAILEMGHIPVGMEMFSAADEEQWKLIARHIQESDYYVVLVAHRYGSTIEGVSYTEKEYDFAVGQGIPTLGFVIAESAAWPSTRREDAALQEIKKFKAKIQQRLVAFWTSADDLSGKVAISLGKQFMVTPRPGWVRATEAIDPSVVNELSRLVEENRRLREDLERIRLAEQSVQAPGLDQSIRLVIDVNEKANRGPSKKANVEIAWLDILGAIGPELMTEPLLEERVMNRIRSAVTRTKRLPKGCYYRARLRKLSCR